MLNWLGPMMELRPASPHFPGNGAAFRRRLMRQPGPRRLPADFAAFFGAALMRLGFGLAGIVSVLFSSAVAVRIRQRWMRHAFVTRSAARLLNSKILKDTGG